MILKTTIKNFRNGKEHIIDWSPGVNVLIGKTDHGKSATLSAIGWPVTNKPTGNDFRSDWGGDTVVVHELSDDYIVTRKKTDKDNLYIIEHPSFEKPIKVKGKDIVGLPEIVENVFNMGEVNVQDQFSRPYLLDMSPGDRAKHFNKSVNLTVIDETKKRANSCLTEEKSNLKKAEVDIESGKEKLENLEWIDDAQKDLDKLVKQEKEIIDLKKDADNLSDMISTMNKNLFSYERAFKFSKALEEIERLEKLSQEINKDLKTYWDLNDLAEGIKKDREELNKYQIFAEAQIDILDLEGLKNDIELGKRVADDLYSLIKSIKEAKKKKQEKDREAEEWENKIHELTGGLCPYCGAVNEKSEKQRFVRQRKS